MSSMRCSVYTVWLAGMCYWGLGGNSCCNLSGLQLKVGLSGHLSCQHFTEPRCIWANPIPFKSFIDAPLPPRALIRVIPAAVWQCDVVIGTCVLKTVLNRKPGLMIHRWLQRRGLGFVMVHVCDLFGCYCGRGPWQRGWMGVGSLVKPSPPKSWCDSWGLMFTTMPGPLNMTIP